MRQAGRVSRVALLAGAFLLGGCVYYNGMYNTNRMAKSARKAERDGRAFEAQGYWGQVVTKADSLVVRHPRRKYADQATVTCVIPGHDRDGEELLTDELAVSDGPLEFSFSGTCGYASTFDYAGTA